MLLNGSPFHQPFHFTYFPGGPREEKPRPPRTALCSQSAVLHTTALPSLAPSCQSHLFRSNSCGFLREMQEGVSCSSINAAAKQKWSFNNCDLFGESSKQKKRKTFGKRRDSQINFFFFFLMDEGDIEGKARSFKKQNIV